MATGLLLAEVNAATLCELGNGGVSLTSMSTRTLGRVGTTVSGLCYVLLHYALLVAYISRAGAHYAPFCYAFMTAQQYVMTAGCTTARLHMFKRWHRLAAASV